MFDIKTSYLGLNIFNVFVQDYDKKESKRDKTDEEHQKIKERRKEKKRLTMATSDGRELKKEKKSEKRKSEPPLETIKDLVPPLKKSKKDIPSVSLKRPKELSPPPEEKSIARSPIPDVKPVSEEKIAKRENYSINHNKTRQSTLLLVSTPK